MWARGLRVLYWTVGDPQRVNEEDADTTLISTLEVIWTNGRRLFTSDAVLDYDVIHALVGSDEMPAGSTTDAVEMLLGNAVEAHPDVLANCEGNPTWAEASNAREHMDGDLLRAAANAQPGEWGLLLEALGSLVDELPPGLSLISTHSRVASIAVQIAWDLL